MPGVTAWWIASGGRAGEGRVRLMAIMALTYDDSGGARAAVLEFRRGE